MSTRGSHSLVWSACAALLLVACAKDKAKPAGEPTPPVAKPSADQPAPPPAAGRIPVTTKSADARALYQKAFALQLALRNTDAHAVYEQAIAKDADFALAYLG